MEPTIQTRMRRAAGFADSDELSLILGGPIFQWLIGSRIDVPVERLVAWRAIAFVAICWIPLVLLSAWQGQLLGGGVAVPFFYDVEVQIRCLAVVPLLIVAELTAHDRMQRLAVMFVERSIVLPSELPRYRSIIGSALKLRNSIWVELILLLLVYGVGVTIIWSRYAALETSTWYTRSYHDVWKPSLAGMWFGYVSLPIFQFLLLRWYFRIFVWARMLWQISRLDLQLIPIHPDRTAGLGFLTYATHAFVPLLAAHGAMLSAVYAGRIFHAQASLPSFRLETVLVIVFLLMLVQGPLLVFSPKLAKAKRQGARDYGTFAETYVRAFDEKWLRGGAAADEPLLGSADIQSLADLDNAFDVIRSVNVLLVTRNGLLLFIAAVIAPVVPLALTMMNLEQLVTKLFGVLF